MMLKNCLGLSVFVLALAASAGAEEQCFYSNDFSERKSTVALPTGQWQSLVYPKAGTLLVANYASASWTYSPDMPWRNPDARVDGWLMGGNGARAPSVMMMTNLVSKGDSDKPYIAVYDASAVYDKGRFVFPFGNAISNGILRIQVDMRAPGKGIATTGTRPMMRIYPAFRGIFEDPDLVSGLGVYPCVFGFQARANGASDWSTVAFDRAFVGAGNGDETSALVGKWTDRIVSSGHWYRYVADINLDAKTFSVSLLDMGTSIPSFETASTSVVAGPETFKTYRTVSEATGPIEGLVLYTAGVYSGTTFDVANAACYRNILAAWKAPGADEMLEFYRNDGCTRLKRSLAQGTTSFTAAGVVAQTHAATYNGYTALSKTSYSGATIAAIGNGSKNYAQPIGEDGWRRQNASSLTPLQIVTSGEAGGNVLRVCGSGFGLGMISLGEKITSGKVRMSVDMRTPQSWTWNTKSYSVWTALGPDALFTANSNEYGEKFVSVVGLSSDDKTVLPQVHYRSNGEKKSEANGAFLTWYRIVTTVDVAAKTYDLVVYDLGSTSHDASFVPTDAMKIVEKSDVALAYDADNVGTLLISAYGTLDKSWESAALFDNLKVWKAVGTADEALLYENDFTRSVRHNAQIAGEDWPVAVDRPHADVDHMTLRTYGDINASVLRAGANPCLKMASLKKTVVQQEVGTGFSDAANAFKFSVDIRPPARWQGADSENGIAAVAIGGASFAQGNTASYDPFLSHALALFGFDNGGAKWANDVHVVDTVRIFATHGAERVRVADFKPDPTHWYRFSGKMRLDRGTYSGKVLDMGAEQPIPTTTGGTLVASFKDLALAQDAEREISAIGEVVAGAAGVSETECACFDNIRAQAVPCGCVMIVR